MNLVSIIVPVYNVNDYLRECLQSIVSQTYKNIEIILIDDGSTDGSGSICDEFAQKDSRIKVIHKINEGVSTARNLGIQLSTGKFVLFVDSDDWIEENYVSELLGEYNKVDYDLVICNYNKIYSQDKQTRPIVLRTEINNFTGDFSKDFYFLRSLLSYPWIKLYQRDIIIKNQICFPKDFTDAEDQVFNYTYFNHVRKYKYIEKFLYNYRYRVGSLSKNTSRKSFECNLKKMKIQKDFLYDNKILKKEIILLEDSLGIIFKYYSSSVREFSEFKSRVQCVKEVVGTISSNNISLFTKKWIALNLIKYNCSTVLYLYCKLKYWFK